MGEAIAHSGQTVKLSGDLGETTDRYHENNDGGAAIPKADGSGYYYVSNSEIGEHPDTKTGGVYSLDFDNDHNLLGYNKVLGDTAKNCHGGETPWGTWVSCEEERGYGRCWQVDPTGVRAPEQTMVTGQTGVDEAFGAWEAFAWDADDNKGYVTNDDYPSKDGGKSYSGAIARFTPDATADACLAAAADDKWCALNSGTTDYLKITPAEDDENNGGTEGTFEWVATKEESNPALYAGSEGAHVEGGIFTFSTILDRYLFRLDLEDGTYVRSAVPFPFEPDNLRVLRGSGDGDTVFLCTDGDDQPGDAVWGWDEEGAYRMLYEEGHSYPAGVDFSTDRKNMLVSMYGHTTYRFWRNDGMAFDEPAKSITYEVEGGIDDGKTHAEIFQQYNKVYDYENPTVIAVSDEPVDEPVPEPVDEPADEPVAEPVDEPVSEPADEPEPEPVAVDDAPSGAASSAMAAGTIAGAIAGAMML